MGDAARLIAALPFWMARRGWRIVVKLGGSAMEEPAALAATLRDLAWLNLACQRVVLVHGGGKPIDRALTLAGIVPRKVHGRESIPEKPVGPGHRNPRDSPSARTTGAYLILNFIGSGELERNIP
jgi:acetylglutamate kinase